MKNVVLVPELAYQILISKTSIAWYCKHHPLGRNCVIELNLYRL